MPALIYPEELAIVIPELLIPPLDVMLYKVNETVSVPLRAETTALTFVREPILIEDRLLVPSYTLLILERTADTFDESEIVCFLIVKLNVLLVNSKFC